MSDRVPPRLTREQSAILSAYTGVLCGDFDALHEYVEKLFGRHVWTLEMGSKEFVAELKEKSKPDFLGICHEQ